MLETNKIHLGDCLELMKQIPDKSIDLVLTDPPYGMEYVSSRRKHKFEAIKNDDNLNWIEPFLEQSYRALKENSHIYLFCNDYNMSELIRAGEKAGFKRKRSLIWVKNNHTSGDLEGDYGNKTEFVVFLHKGRKELNGKRDCNVLFFDRTACEIHPTQKPIKLIEYLACKSSNSGDLILDPFSGSGTTAIACHNLNRNFICIEKDTDYHRASVQRLKEAQSQLRLAV